MTYFKIETFLNLDKWNIVWANSYNTNLKLLVFYCMFCVSQKLNLAFYCFQSSQLSTHRHTRLSAISLETGIISLVCSPDLCKQFTTKRFIIITLPHPVCVQMPGYKATAIRAPVHSTCSHTINHKHDRGWCKLSFFNRYKYCLRVAPKQFLNYKK